MKLIIDIPDMYYSALKQADIIISGKRNGKTLESIVYDAVGKGTPLTECEDVISRQAAKDLYCAICKDKNVCYRLQVDCEDIKLFDKLSYCGADIEGNKNEINN